MKLSHPYKLFDFYREPTSNTRLDIQQVAQFGDHYCTVWRVTWNITGTMLASTGDDGCVRMWKSMSALLPLLNKFYRISVVFSELSKKLEVRRRAEGGKSAVCSGKFHRTVAEFVQHCQCYCKVLQAWNHQSSYSGAEALNIDSMQFLFPDFCFQ